MLSEDWEANDYNISLDSPLEQVNGRGFAMSSSHGVVGTDYVFQLQLHPPEGGPSG